MSSSAILPKLTLKSGVVFNVIPAAGVVLHPEIS
jgi:hypothetical protein